MLKVRLLVERESEKHDLQLQCMPNEQLLFIALLGTSVLIDGYAFLVTHIYIMPDAL